MFVQIITTGDDREMLEKLAHRLVSERLAACVQTFGPIDSVYRWQDRIETSREWICFIKSTQAFVDRIEQVIRSLHSYDEPEIIVTEIITGSPGYLMWLADQLGPEPAG